MNVLCRFPYAHVCRRCVCAYGSVKIVFRGEDLSTLSSDLTALHLFFLNYGSSSLGLSMSRSLLYVMYKCKLDFIQNKQLHMCFFSHHIHVCLYEKRMSVV